MNIIQVPISKQDYDKLMAQAKARGLKVDHIAEIYLSEKINNIHFTQKA